MAGETGFESLDIFFIMFLRINQYGVRENGQMEVF